MVMKACSRGYLRKNVQIDMVWEFANPTETICHFKRRQLTFEMLGAEAVVPHLLNLQGDLHRPAGRVFTSRPAEAPHGHRGAIDRDETGSIEGEADKVEGRAVTDGEGLEAVGLIHLVIPHLHHPVVARRHQVTRLLVHTHRCRLLPIESIDNMVWFE